jgi:acetyl esterase/lipase
MNLLYWRQRDALLVSTLCAGIAVSCSTTAENGKAPASENAPNAKVAVDSDGAVHLPAMTVPFSSFASPEAKAKFVQEQPRLQNYIAQLKTAKNIADERRFSDDYDRPSVELVHTMYATEQTRKVMGGVETDIYTPKEGIAARNQHRVLINLHGGSFRVGAHTATDLESIPLASIAKVKIVGVNYRMATEYKFPAASEDVAAVYKELLKSYPPQNIGIYGCSAGGVLTAEATAWIAKEHLPRPGAVGIFCASAAGWIGGDSGALAQPLSGMERNDKVAASPHASISNEDYFSDADMHNPLVEPIHSDAVLAKFPPTLLITSTRDIALSGAAYTNERLTKLGVESELHVWEGLGHFFFGYPDLPESKEMWNVVARFFDKHLGAR